MSGGHYRNLEVTSSNGAYHLKAQSPDNHPGQYGWSRNFHYRMYRQSGHLCWERRAKRDEPAPLEIILSDDGFTAIHLHCPVWFPRLMLVDAEGRELIQVGIGGPDELPEGWAGAAWISRDMAFSTRGNFWTMGSWPYFVTLRDQRHFVCRGRSGQRLIVRLASETIVIPEEEVDAQILKSEEISAALDFLSEGRPQLLEARSENQAAWDLDRKLGRCLTLLAAYLPVECAPLLQKLEGRPLGGGYSSCHALGYDVKVLTSMRPRIQTLLKRLGASVSGLPSYDFRENDLPLQVARERGNVNNLAVGQTPRETLQLIGSPDFIHSWFGPERRSWSETWEYDEFDGKRWSTMYIAWDLKNKPPTISSIAPAKIDWERREEHLTRLYSL